ncbi:MAG: hypothetical protein OEL87_01260 [Nanoarchaeota archaeon]|nr:hypothetical protein [Nanoarchaeota archaeon]
MNPIEKIKQKKEFSGLPDSIVERVSEMTKGDVKESRSLLRKYFGVFLTNRVLKGKGSAEEILATHISSKKRDYKNFYGEIFSGVLDARDIPSGLEISKKASSLSGSVSSVVDLGCGVNGFSYGYLREVIGDVNYIGIEAAGQLVEQMNKYFKTEGFSAKAIVGDLFNIDEVLKILKKQKKDRIVFLFQVIDALENLERDFSKEFIMKISKECEGIVLSLPTESLGGRKKFAVQRKWLIDFLEENFLIEKDFVIRGERVIYLNLNKPKIR